MAAMQGLMVTGMVGDKANICVDEALKAVMNDEKATAALPTMLGKKSVKSFSSAIQCNYIN